MKFIKKSLIFFLSLALIIIINVTMGISSIRFGMFPRVQSYLVTTAMVTMRHQYIANIVASDATINKIMEANTVATISEDTNKDNITIIDEQPEVEEVAEVTNLFKDKDKQDVNITNINSDKFKGYILTVSNPKKIKLAVTKDLGEYGTNLNDLIKQENGIAGVNASGFVDVDGKGNGGVPTGVIIKDGEVLYYEKGFKTYSLIGFDKNGILTLGNYTIKQMKDLNIQDGISFGPFLIVNNKPATIYGDGGWGINPRTAIGQKQDGTIIFVVIDGRQLNSIGATIKEVQDIMIEEGCVNAANLDGGSSSVMYHQGKLINSPSSKYGERPLPSAWIIK
ncbi:phosphodiester glycosidase family protein [Clostridium tagluense]|uniref:phosphodiester glycosidase family protein n=1 Tax=Clostridium tagluense TaxID=360422 RepID=UPI001CF2A51E|nr:phosphodiester glycosidase family protein [Clostridium tagluense]MCB2312877.1 phosphodiester glycosidase family protein [Clostridium tagluense]MCB2317643.1 phosphodiester glycosidase family protein [Clostridium tagluense]MCB2322400.1 phosphodiester glycosidase family protein [Clostridium tagluense]MCB2327403.1 phosphodiester glycosidase family protein [Clostridium tagluense]MCB2332145.1 phosphodiester glycosidase family protein [Clostridium tagluense]